MSRVELSVAPTAEPVSVAEARAHLRQASDITVDDGLVNDLIPSCTRLVESYVGLSLITQTWKWWLDYDEVDRVIKLDWPLVPLQSISSVVMYDEDNTGSTATSTTYYTVTQGRRPLIALKSGQVWPTISIPRKFNYCCITGVAGYGSAASSISEAEFFIAAEAIKDLVFYCYANRGNTDSQRLLIQSLNSFAFTIPPEIAFKLSAIRIPRLY